MTTTDFPVEGCAIAAEGLQMIERVTGRVGYRQAALSAFVNGAWVGAVVGLVLGLFTARPLLSGLVLAMWGLLVSGVVASILWLVGGALGRDRGEFASVQGLHARRYDVVVTAGRAAAAGGSSTAVTVTADNLGTALSMPTGRILRTGRGRP